MQDIVFAAAAEVVAPAAALDGDSDVGHMNHIHIYIAFQKLINMQFSFMQNTEEKKRDLPLMVSVIHILSISIHLAKSQYK